jgi:hypothetical protein
MGGNLTLVQMAGHIQVSSPLTKHPIGISYPKKLRKSHFCNFHINKTRQPSVFGDAFVYSALFRANFPPLPPLPTACLMRPPPLPLWVWCTEHSAYCI